MDYFYRSTDGQFKPLPDRASRPADLAQTTTSHGLTVDYIVSVERGTINRFIYGIAMLAPFDYTPHSPHLPRVWNERLIFSFGTGGGGVGYRQQRMNVSEVLVDELLSQGYAVAYTTGARTARSYNMVVAEESVMMLKHHFAARYGQPIHTIGIGASGGGLTQYILSQNHPGLLDAIVPVVSYPDMITQSIYVMDCELLEYYLDNSDNPRWKSAVEREVFVGLAGNDTLGATACAGGWRGSTQGFMNPWFPLFSSDTFSQDDVAGMLWTHWDDLRNVYGTDEYGFALNSWDNVGVQYGLVSLQRGLISKEEFLDLNERIGGWKPQHEYGAPSLPYDEGNMNVGVPGQPNRTQGSIIAMNRAYQSGQIFMGHANLPIIDLRKYTDPMLDQHHFLQSFAARERIINTQGHAGHQLIWVRGTQSAPGGTFMGIHRETLDLILTTIEEWLQTMSDNPGMSVAEAKPAHAVDRCWADDGTLIGEGAEVWNKGGVCHDTFPPYETSRTLAGAPIAGDVFKCQLMSVEEALQRGLYPSDGPNAFTDEDINRLQTIFPDGVCDYSLRDAGYPEGWFR